MFGRHGTWCRDGRSTVGKPEAWRDAIVTGATIDTPPSSTDTLAVEPFMELLDASKLDGRDPARLEHPENAGTLWRNVASSLGADPSWATGELADVVDRSVVEAGARIAHS